MMLHLFIILPLVMLISSLPFSQRKSESLSFGEKLQSWWTATACRIFGLRIVVTGELIQGPGLMVANHISWLDIPLIYGVAPMSFVSKAEVNRWPILGTIARFGKTVFHDRGCHDSARNVAESMTRSLQAGNRVAIFPEGGILGGPGVKPFHARLFAAAAESKSPVQPIMLRYVMNGRHFGAIGFLPNEHFVANFFRLLGQPPRQAEVALLPVIDFQGQQRKELASAAKAAVEDAYDEGLLR